MVDDSFVSFSSPETLAALFDLGTLIYSDLQGNNSLFETQKFISQIQETTGVFDDGVYSLGLNMLDVLGTQLEAQNFWSLIAETKGPLSDTHQLITRLQEIKGVFDDSVHSLILKMPDVLGAHTETQIYSVLVNDLSGAFVETGQLFATTQEDETGLVDTFQAFVQMGSIDSKPALTETMSALFRVAESLGAFTERSTFSVSLIGNSHAATSGWTNPANAVDNSLTTDAVVAVAGSGLAGITSNSASAASDIDFPDFALPAGFSIVSAFMDVYSRAAHVNSSAVSPGSASFTNNYSLNSGGSYTALASRSGSATAQTVFWDDSVVPNSFNLTGDITTQSQINGFRFRTAVQVVSGGTGSPPSTSLSFYGVVLRLVISG
jgi:hypothetical protein